MSSKVSGPCAPSTFASNHSVTRGTSTPLISVITDPLRGPSPQVGEGTAAGTLPPMSIDVTDATFPTEVVERSKQVPVVVDLWAEWCGPCKTLGPILEKVIDETGGKVVLAKVDVDTNRQTAAAFQVQGIPAVYALKDGKVVDGFVGAQPEANVREFVAGLLPTEAEDAVASLLAAGDEASLRQALDARARARERRASRSPSCSCGAAPTRTRRRRWRSSSASPSRPTRGASRRWPASASTPTTTSPTSSTACCPASRTTTTARQRFVDLLEVMGPDDPRTAAYRKRLTAQLF